MTYDEWVKTACQPAYRPTNGHENRIMRVAFRSAQKMAIDECCTVLQSRKIAIECATEFEQAYTHAIDDIVEAIRATIPDGQP